MLAIFNLNLKTNEEDIRREFGGYGAIVKCRIVMDQKRNKSRGFCFITFGEEKDAIAAKTKAHGSTIHDKEYVTRNNNTITTTLRTQSLVRTLFEPKSV